MGKQKLEAQFETVLARGDQAFVPYIMAGDGGMEETEKRLAFLEACGATAIELGIPFSDPVADGPVIQAAGLRAFKAGTTMKKSAGPFKSPSKASSDYSHDVFQPGFCLRAGKICSRLRECRC